MKFITVILLLCHLPGLSQQQGNAIIKRQQVLPMNGLNGSRNAFIKNIGQYGDTMAGHAAMGTIKYGYESNNMLVLFTPKGLIHLHRKIERPSEREEKALERKGVPEEEIEKKVTVTDKFITVAFDGANPDPAIIAEDETTDYHTYGLLKDKAHGYKKITYKDLYPGVDIVYHFTNTNKTGFEYSIVLQPGANLNLVKLKYGGDIKKIQVDKMGNLLINSGIDVLKETMPVAFSNTDASVKLSVDEKHPQQLYDVSFQVQNKLVNFSVPGYDKTKTLVIDPFVSNTNSLTGTNIGKAKDIDFDYDGNIYVAGGGNPFTAFCQLAKYDPSGTLLWTFDGTVAAQTWSWGQNYGGWVVEKSSGNIFIGQGFVPNGTRVIRLSSAGVYDNFITDQNGLSLENWKMLWSCNNGNPQILIAGGGVTSNINFGICSPPSPTVSISNITGLPLSGQDIADIVVDPLTNDMYTIFSGSINNIIYKNAQPYNPSSIAWQVPSGYNALVEVNNRPYLNIFGSENSVNVFAINSSYLYYWDGLHLKAFNKADGSTAGTPLTITGNTVKMQGGIVADECNNIFIGNTNGTIKVYKFDGVAFNDAAAPDINIPGFSSASVYDLVYDEARRLLYASGDGFVASFDISSYCTASSVFNMTVTPDCLALSVQANINPAPPSGTTVTYVLFVGTTQIAANATGLFTGLATGTNYTLKAVLNQACSGIQLIQNFTLDECFPVISATFINPSCNLSNGSINASAINGTPPYQFSIDGVNFLASGIFTGLSAGNYSIIVKDANNFRDTIDILLANSLPLQVTASTVAASCSLNNGIITATGSGGAAPLKYSIDGITFGASGTFTGLAPGNYTITVKDTNACTVSIPVFLDGCHPVISGTFINPSCNLSNGSIDVAVTSGTAPYQFSKDGIIFQVSNLFTGLSAGNYSIIVKDANNFRDTIDFILINALPLQVTASAVAASCAQNDGIITATGSGGSASLKYSIDGITFGVSGIFTGLAPGNYTITVKDTNACIASIPVFLDGCHPVISGTFINPSCNLSNGSITAAAVSGKPPYQFSKDGINFQASGIFNGLVAGNYSIIVKDANNLKDTLNITLVNSLPLQVTTSTIATSCTKNDGVITATGSGGSAPLKYSIDGITFGTSGTFTGLAAGNYTITVKDTNACTAAVPVIVSTLNTVFANAGISTTICEGGKTTLAAVSNGNAVLWTPSAGLNNQNILNPDASPATTTTYTLTATTGICKASNSVTVFVNPAPVANAGRDTGICFGADVQLNGSGGVSYSWTPATYLSATNIANPFVVKPNTGSITYRVSVTDINGCVSLKNDEVTISISQPAKLFAGNDTTIAINQPLPLFASDVNNTGFLNYTWSPAYGLNNPFVKNPIAVLNRDIQYTVIAQNAYGCTGTDDIKIKVYQGPEIYVPNAFTPDGDGLNDVLKPIVVGMKAFHYFRVFNRYGQMIFTSANALSGWDGHFKTAKQPFDTYVWMVEAVDYLGNIIQRKGTVVLLR